MCAERERDTQGRVGSNVFSSSSPWEKKNMSMVFKSTRRKKGGGVSSAESVLGKKTLCHHHQKGGSKCRALYRESLLFCFFIFLFNELEALPTNYWGLFLAAQRGETQGG